MNLHVKSLHVPYDHSLTVDPLLVHTCSIYVGWRSRPECTARRCRHAPSAGQQFGLCAIAFRSSHSGTMTSRPEDESIFQINHFETPAKSIGLRDQQKREMVGVSLALASAWDGRSCSFIRSFTLITVDPTFNLCNHGPASHSQSPCTPQSV